MSFSYSGPSAVATFVAGAFNDAADHAKLLSEQAKTEFTAGRAYISQFPQTPRSDSATLGDITELATRITPAQMSITRAFNEWKLGVDRRDNLNFDTTGPVRAFQNRLSNDIAGFFNTYFPNSAGANAAAVKQMRDGIKYGRTTIRQSVESLAFHQQRDAVRKKALIDTKAALLAGQNAVSMKPSGALVRKVAMIEMQSQLDIAEASNKIALAAFDKEAAATQVFVDAALKARREALDRFGDYMTRMVVARFDNATAEAGEQDDFRRGLLEATLADHDAAKESELWTRALRTKQFEIDYAALDETEKFELDGIEQLVNASMSAAQRLSTMAATAFNIIRGNAAMSGNEQL